MLACVFVCMLAMQDTTVRMKADSIRTDTAVSKREMSTHTQQIFGQVGVTLMTEVRSKVKGFRKAERTKDKIREIKVTIFGK